MANEMDYEQTCADTLELIQELLEEDSLRPNTRIEGVYTLTTADGELGLFVQLKGGQTIRVEAG